MRRNVGKTDRWIRILVGAAILAIGIANRNWWGAIGLLPLLTAAVRWCPLYALIGISTEKNREA